jgi:hypothetical protein
VHRCGACKSLKKSFREEGDKLVTLSSKFVMVSVEGDTGKELGVRSRCLCINCCIESTIQNSKVA